jgi:hypothetical protein
MKRKAILWTAFLTLVFMLACSQTILQTAQRTPESWAAPVTIPKATYTVTPEPTATPTAIPPVHQTKLEIVTNNAVTGNGGNGWGGHQTRIVHTQDGIFTAYTIEGSDILDRKWNLAERQDDGTWTVIANGRAGREPVNLLASPDGTLHIIGWPEGEGTLWSGRPVNGTLAMTTTTIPNMISGYWPYSSAGIDESGDICVLSSFGGSAPGGRFNWACYLPTEKKWVTQTNKLDYRFTYTYVFPGPDGQLSLVSTRDMLWEGLGYDQPTGAFGYAYNAFGYWRTEDVSKVPLKRNYVQEEKPTAEYPYAVMNAQEDVYIDTKGSVHVLYHVQGESTQGALISRHAIIAPNGKVTFDGPLPEAAGDYSRIFQDKEGTFYLLGSAGLIYPMGPYGVLTEPPIKLDLGGYHVDYAGFGLSVPRTGTPLSNLMDVVFPSGNGTQWIYFQLEFTGQ